jgi:hypothetical protein
MSVPPSGGWPQAPRPDSGQPGPGYPGQHPQQPYPGPPGPWPPQQGYPPPVPPSKGNGLKWLLGGLAVLLVIGLAVTTTLLLTRDKTPAASGTSTAPSDVASANDTGPVSIITVEPTCTAYYSINNAVAAVQSNGWGDERDSLGPAAQWTSDQRTRTEAVAAALRTNADQLVPLAKQTPHRVVRELYEQIIAYARAYVDSIPTYEVRDNLLANTFVNAQVAVLSLCNSITYGSAVRATLDPPAAPSSPVPLGDPANPQRFVTKSDATCEAWIPREDKFVADTDAWSKYDSGIPAANWSPEQRAANEAAFPVTAAYTDAIEKAGRSSGNPILEDFAVAAALYMRAWVNAGINFVPADGWLNATGSRFGNVVSSACEAVGSN